MIQLILIFSIVLLLLKLKQSLYIAIGLGSISAIFLYGISLNEAWQLIGNGIFQQDTIELLLAFYGINLLQNSLELREQRFGKTFGSSRLFSSNRLNVMAMPFLIGLLPSAGAVSLAAPVVNSISREYLSKEEKAFVTSYYRHISESFLPTYTYIILAVNLSGCSMGMLQIAILPSVFCLFLLGYLFYVRKIPNTGHKQKSNNKGACSHIGQLWSQYWTLVLLVSIILICNVPVHIAVLPVIILFFILNKCHRPELKKVAVLSLQLPIMLDTILTMVFKEILLYTDFFDKIPDYLMTFRLPPLFVFVLLFFIGSLVVGSQATMALIIPLAYASIPDGGIGLLVLAISTAFVASQISPTHVCLLIAAEYFQCSFWDLLKKTLPVVILYLILILLYSVFLCTVF